MIGLSALENADRGRDKPGTEASMRYPVGLDNA
jgi:hypothetical protein